MRTLEDRLTQASDEARRQVNQVDIRPASTVGRRVHQRRALVGAAAVALVLGTFGGTALFVGSGVESESAPGAGEAAPPTTVIDSTVPTSDTTTATIVAEPKLPPALRGTPLTTAWGEYVVETMVMAGYEMAGYEIAGMDVFEKETDRGLVHATFTVDGDEWALAFGPWRDGEYSDDPAVLQEHFSTEKPAQETAEGLLLISERSDPSYVYLAMDIGKIAISFQPAIIGSAVPLEELGALALDLAPIARQLLEADLIEWNT